MISAPPQLQWLTPELLHNIYQYLPPSDHFNLAATSKTIYARSEYVLNRHRAAYRNISVASDLSPLIVAQLFESTAFHTGLKAIDAWHVREFEIWGSRLSWDDCGQWQPDPRGVVFWREDLKPDQNLISRLTRRAAAIHLKEFESTNISGLADVAQKEIKDGGDGFVKMTIISKLPRLRALRFVERQADPQTTLDWMTLAIDLTLDLHRPWPQGFTSLRKVAVGVPILSPKESDASGTRAEDLSRLLRLPNIDEVYFRNLDMSDDPELYHPGRASEFFKLGAGSSSVKTLILDKMREDTYGFREALVLAPAGLETLVVRGSPQYVEEDIETEGFVTLLQQSHSRDMLQRLLFYRPDCLSAPNVTSFDASLLEELPYLRTATVCVRDLVDATYMVMKSYWKGPGESEHESKDKCMDAYCICTAPRDKLNPHLLGHSHLVFGFIHLLPSELEVLVLWGQETSRDTLRHFARGPYEENETLEAGIIAMMDCGRFPNLKAVYVDEIERDVASPRSKVAFQKAVEKGKKCGVQVFTVANDEKPRHQPGFVPMPDKYDLKTGMFGERDPSLVVDSFTGEWAPPPGSGSCAQYYTQEALREFRGWEH